VREIRIQTEVAHRVFHVATFGDAVYVLHAFEKRTRKTPPHEVTLARDRYRALLTPYRCLRLLMSAGPAILARNRRSPLLA
jgi:phage-related protein